MARARNNFHSIESYSHQNRKSPFVVLHNLGFTERLIVLVTQDYVCGLKVLVNLLVLNDPHVKISHCTKFIFNLPD